MLTWAIAFRKIRKSQSNWHSICCVIIMNIQQLQLIIHFKYQIDVLKYGRQFIIIYEQRTFLGHKSTYFSFKYVVWSPFCLKVSKVWKALAWQLDAITAMFLFLCCRVLHTVSCCQSAISSLSARLVTLMEADVCVQTHVCVRGNAKPSVCHGAYHCWGQCHFLFNKS